MGLASAPRLPEQFSDYEKFRDWVFESFPETASTTLRGNTFRDFIISLLPETRLGRRFGRLEPAAKQSHDRGVDVVSAIPENDRLALQSKLAIREKSEIDDIISKFQDYEATIASDDQMKLVQEDDGQAPIVFAIATSSRLKGIIAKYEAAQLASRPFYERLKAEERLLVWDGLDLLRDARQVLTRRYELPMQVELSSTSDWSGSGDVRLGIVKGRDLAALEELHGPGLFFENVRGWKGLEPTKNDETVNEAILATIVEDPAEMLARNNGTSSARPASRRTAGA